MYTVIKIRGDNCPGCKIMQPIYNDLKNNNKREDIVFSEIKVEENMEVIELLKVRSIPTIIVEKDNDEIGRKAGVQMPQELKERIYSLTN